MGISKGLVIANSDPLASTNTTDLTAFIPSNDRMQTQNTQNNSLMATSYPECDSLPTEQKRRICRNEAGLPLNGKNSVNKYRAYWGLPLIEDKNLVDNSIIPIPPKSKAPSRVIKGVGDFLHEVLTECGINPPCITCGSFAAKMNWWGIKGCETTHRAEIIDHLKAEAKKASWLDWVKVAAKGYLSSEQLLEEAIRRAKQEEAKSDKLGESQ